MSSNAQTLQTNYIAKLGKYRVDQYVKYKGGWFKIERFPDSHTALAKNCASTSDLPQQVRILINEL